MADEVVRYEPGEAIRWIQIGAGSLRGAAKTRATSVVQRTGDRNWRKDIRDSAQALLGAGKSALADLARRQAEATEYHVSDAGLDVIKPTSKKHVNWSEVIAIELTNGGANVRLRDGHVAIQPSAYILAGAVKVPVGWSRNGLEVPFEILAEEIAARAGCSLTTS